MFLGATVSGVRKTAFPLDTLDVLVTNGWDAIVHNAGPVLWGRIVGALSWRHRGYSEADAQQ